jgi:hypothetical protein
MAGGVRGGVLVAVLAFCTLTATAGAVTIEVVGPEQTIYDYATMNCRFDDVPDGPARAFRDASNRVQLMLTGGDTRMIGPSLDSMTHDCVQTLVDHGQPNPWDYDDGDWLSGLYTADGQTIHALVHAEYHGQTHPGWCPGEPFIKCRFHAATYARSTDGGESYQHTPGPADLVAVPPYRYVPGEGRYGYFAPSNIVQKDGWFYSMLLVSVSYKKQRYGTCLMRTQDVADPKSWRAWDGDGFNVRFIDPYRESPEPIHRHVCQPVSSEEIRDMNRSLTYNSFLDKYVITGTSTRYDAAQGRNVSGFYFSTSDDLIKWTDRQLLMEVETLGTYLCGDQNPRVYPGILDGNSPDRNFSIVDQDAYLYFTELIYENCQLRAERDMLRVPIRFSP